MGATRTGLRLMLALDEMRTHQNPSGGPVGAETGFRGELAAGVVTAVGMESSGASRRVRLVMHPGRSFREGPLMTKSLVHKP